ncbi:hypothetical protein AQUCO_04200148v1 [Aquilegia coerulea]|uniref:Iron hydrogenase large subunit C-terminal domain-containing protein n=1 Tax=Aquilegia coerulea TaxID=218851 RepID=A0A2G5CPK4_AQUCA|nr:hypothetical protein AQUCO_04200148v1 [Aquilegia coerulea]
MPVRLQTYFFQRQTSVMTTAEVLNLIQLKSVDFLALEESSLDKLLTKVDDVGHLYGLNGSSGGYAEPIFRHTAKTIFGIHIEGPLNFKTKKKFRFSRSDFRSGGENSSEICGLLWIQQPA